MRDGWICETKALPRCGTRCGPEAAKDFLDCITLLAPCTHATIGSVQVAWHHSHLQFLWVADLGMASVDFLSSMMFGEFTLTQSVQAPCPPSCTMTTRPPDRGDTWLESDVSYRTLCDSAFHPRHHHSGASLGPRHPKRQR